MGLRVDRFELGFGEGDGECARARMARREGAVVVAAAVAEPITRAESKPTSGTISTSGATSLLLARDRNIEEAAAIGTSGRHRQNLHWRVLLHHNRQRHDPTRLDMPMRDIADVDFAAERPVDAEHRSRRRRPPPRWLKWAAGGRLGCAKVAAEAASRPLQAARGSAGHCAR